MYHGIAPKVSGIEIGSGAEAVSAIKALIKSGIKPKQVHADVCKQLTNDWVCHPWLDERLRAAIGDQRFAIDHMLIAPGMTAEIVVVI